MIDLLSELIVVSSCLLLLLLSVAVVGVMSRSGMWGAFSVWAGVALTALVVAVQWRDLPLPAALLLLVLTLMIWRLRRRIAWAVEHGRAW